MLKIKFLDTGEELEVTEAAQLANTKFYCRGKSELDLIESLGFRKYQGEDPHYKDEFGVTVSLWDDMEYSRSIGFDNTGKPFREFVLLPTEPLTTPDNEPVSQPSAEPGQEVTPEALEAEGWEIVGKDWEKGTPRKFKRGNVFAEFLTNGHLILHTGGGSLKGVSTFQDLRTLDRLVNGVAIPS